MVYFCVLHQFTSILFIANRRIINKLGLATSYDKWMPERCICCIPYCHILFFLIICYCYCQNCIGLCVNHLKRKCLVMLMWMPICHTSNATCECMCQSINQWIRQWINQSINQNIYFPDMQTWKPQFFNQKLQAMI